MAIQVNGTTVIDDSRNLANVGGLKTVNGNNLVGSGDISAGASTTYAAVGTYTTAIRRMPDSTYAGGTTIAGSSLLKYDNTGSAQILPFQAYSTSYGDTSSAGLSGTWRLMSPSQKAGSYGQVGGLYVRIS